MKRLIRFVAGLYPRSWQERYGAEFSALLEDVNPDWRTSADILKGALEMQMRTLSFGKISLVAGMVGVLVAAGVSFAVPKQYASKVVLKAAGPDAMYAVYTLVQRTLSQRALMSIIVTEGLYQGERTRMPIEDVIERMRRRVRVTPVAGSPTPSAFAIEFAYTDPHKAQRVTEDLASSFVEENMRLREQGGAFRLTLQLLDMPNLPQKPVSPNQWMIAGVGLGAACGIALALMLAFKLRVSRRTA